MPARYLGRKMKAGEKAEMKIPAARLALAGVHDAERFRAADLFFEQQVI